MAAATETRDSVAPTPPRRRPGRPRMQDVPLDEELLGDGDSRKVRLRQAQRSYRHRKENALHLAQAQAAKREEAMSTMFETFQKFHNFVIQRRDLDLPPEVMRQLSSTSMQMSTIMQGAKVTESCSADQGKKASENTDATTPLAESFDFDRTQAFNLINNSRALVRVVRGRVKPSLRLRRGDEINSGQETKETVRQMLIDACLDKSMGLPPNRMGSLHCFLPVSLESPYEEALAAHTALSLYMPRNFVISDAEYPMPITRLLPEMFRVIEGCPTVALPRLAPPRLQHLEFGKTRTCLKTPLPALQGEWLEAADVEEYLAQRGIFVREGGLQSGKSPGVRTRSLGTEVPYFDLRSSTAPQTAPDSSGFWEELRSPADTSIYEQLRLTGEAEEKWPSLSKGTIVDVPNLDFTIFGKTRDDGQQLPQGTLTFSPPPDYWTSGFEDSCQEHLASGDSNTTAPPDPDLQSIEITIQLETLIKELANRFVCLGVAPGIRREGVDAAIREAVCRDPIIVL